MTSFKSANHFLVLLSIACSIGPNVFAQTSVDVKLLIPQDNATIARNPWGFFEFWWEGSTENALYTLEVSKTRDFENLIYFQTVNRIHDFTRHLPDKGTVFWRVKFKDQISSVRKLNIIPPKDSSIKIEKARIIPFKQEQQKRGEIILSWQEPSKKGPYDVEVSPDPDFKKLVFRKRVNAQSYSLDNFADAGQFFWRVRKGRIVSPVGKFRINQAMVNQSISMQAIYIHPIAPINGDHVETDQSEIAFKWEPLPVKTKYLLEISKNGDFQTITFSQETEKTELIVPNLREKGTYFWRLSSPRYESPVQSFVLSESTNFFEKSLSLFSLLISSGKKSNFWLEANYKLSALKGHDLTGSTSGTLRAKQLMNFEAGYRKNLFPTWDIEVSGDFSIISREPPDGFEIRTPVNNLIGGQAGIYNFLLTDLRVGLFGRYSEFELAKSITGSFFEMEKSGGMSFGAEGVFSVWKKNKYQILFNALFFSVLPLSEDLQSAYTREVGVSFQYPFFLSNPTTLGFYWEDIGVIKKNTSQSSKAIGFRWQLLFE